MYYVVKMICVVLVLAIAVPASASLVLHLDFDDSSQIGKAIVGDSLEAVGDAVYTTDGKIGGGLSLDGDGDYLQLNDAGALPTGIPAGDSSYTVAAFFKTTIDDKNGIVGWGAPSLGNFNGTRTGYLTGQESDFSHIQNYSWGPDNDCLSTEVNFADDQWHHIAAVYDSTTLTKTLYFDGTQVGSMVLVSALNVAGENFHLGSIHFLYNGAEVSEDFTGTLDDVRIYDSALTETEIGDLIPMVPELIPGDANNDKKVDGSDVTILAGNWQVGVDGLQTATWEMGDFNNDGKVDGSDVTILAGNWQYGVTAAAASVPEPNTIALLISVFASLLVWRRVR